MFLRLLPFLALVLFSPVIASAKSGPEHCRDMLDVLGITPDMASSPVFQNANEAAKFITAKIDEDYSPLRMRIASVAPDFSMGPSLHRLFFHWGFNEDPRQNAALSEQVNLATESQEVRRIIWDLILEEQGVRNRAMMSKVATEFNRNSGLMLSRDEQNALASIMYNTHILGDYAHNPDPTWSRGMVSIDAIIADTLRSLRLRLREPNMELVREFEQQLNTARGMPGTAQKAREILEWMKEYIPRILKDNRRMRRIVYGYAK